MSDRLNALGQYIIEQTKRNFNFKQIKNDPIYYNILFTFGTDDYLLTDDKDEITATIQLMEFRAFHKDYPPKQLKRYTHRKFEKIHKKKEEYITVKGKRYIIIKL